MKIEGLGEAAGVGAGTIRGYQRLGLVPVRERYRKRDVGLVRLVVNARRARVPMRFLQLAVAAHEGRGASLDVLLEAALSSAEHTERKIEQLRREADGIRGHVKGLKGRKRPDGTALYFLLLALQCAERP